MIINDFHIFFFSFSVTILAYTLPCQLKNTRHPIHFENFAKICYKIIMHVRKLSDLSSGAFDTCAFAPSPFIHAQHCYCSYVLLRCPHFRVPCPAFSTPVRWVPRFPVLRFPPLHFGPEFFSPAFSVSLSEVPYYFWATLYSLLVLINTRYLFN